ncbi:MAG: OsmC family protein [Candidatus Palauibacterales bacterium]|nr:OsmC family protein [Candidatus Palauibacterales bacterium]MDP2530248.1 OsmC family protein [Candidatus Palauibacterales bacterium]MDP2583033.1 OsmC family protein [Candidatus Palauibacterales bacterium]
MLGTLNGALEVREVRLDPDAITAEVEGVNEVRDGVPVLTEIRIHYRLRIPAGTRERVERALERHQSRCPTAQSLRGAVVVSWTADIEDEESGSGGRS